MAGEVNGVANVEINTTSLRRYAARLSSVNSSIRQLDAKLSQLASRAPELNRLTNSRNNSTILSYTNELQKCQNYLSQTAADFERTENILSNCNPLNFSMSGKMAAILKVGAIELPLKEESAKEKFIKEFRASYGWGDLLKGSGYIGTVYDLIQDIKKGDSWKDFAKTGVDIYQFLTGAAKTFSNYKRIGRAVGTKTAMAWWAKSITGLKPLGRASTAKNVFTRFANNLTNKTSPFNAEFNNVIGNFKGINGVGKAVASWGAVAVTGITNWFGNKEEQANSNGTMTTGRVIAETVTETAVDTAMTYGAGIVVGAAVTAVAGTVAAPGILVVAAGGLVVAGLNAGVKALTGKTTTEWVSDTILDTGEAIGKAVGNVAKKVSSTIGNWFHKLSFA